MAHVAEARAPMLAASGEVSMSGGPTGTTAATTVPKKARINPVISQREVIESTLSAAEALDIDTPLPLFESPQMSMGEEALGRQCRYCLETVSSMDTSGNSMQQQRGSLSSFGPERMIAPCQCTGSQKWVHRKCLDKWRTINPNNSRAFTHCGICGFQFRLVLANPTPTEDQQVLRQRRLRFVRQVTMHFVLGLLVVQLLIFGVALLIRYIDKNEFLVKNLSFFPGEGHNANDNMTLVYSIQHHKSIYYCAAVIVLTTLLGMFGIIVNCVKVCSEPGPNNEPACSGCVFDCFTFSGADCCLIDGGCSCGECSSGAGCECEGEGGCACAAGLALIVAVAVALLVFLCGFFFAIALLIMWCQRGMTKYVQMKQMRQLAEEYMVDDLSRIPTGETMAPDNMSFQPRSVSVGSMHGTPNQVSNPMIMSFPPIGGGRGTSYTAPGSNGSYGPGEASGARGSSGYTPKNGAEVERSASTGARQVSFLTSMSFDNQQEYMHRNCHPAGSPGHPDAPGLYMPFAPVTSREVSQQVQKDLALMFGDTSHTEEIPRTVSNSSWVFGSSQPRSRSRGSFGSFRSDATRPRSQTQAPQTQGLRQASGLSVP